MEVEVYADLLFLINAGMDGLCLSIGARLLHRRVRGWRVAIAAALGGIYAVLALFLDTGRAVALGVDMAVCLLLCAVAYGWHDGRGWKGFLGGAAVFTAIAMVMGGVMTALFNLCNRAGLSDLLPAGGEGIGAWLFLLFSVAGSVLSLCGGRFVRRSRRVRSCAVTIETDGASCTLRGLCDSGNLLRDPIGGRAVICVTADALEGILSPAMMAVMRAGGTHLAGADTATIRRLRLIPAHTATGGGMLAGFRPDRVTLAPEGGEAREVDAVVAVLLSPPTATAGVGEIEALVPAELL